MNISDKKTNHFLVLLAVLIGVLFLQTMFYYTGGHISTPTTDYFVFFQYAKQLVAGHPFEFNTGDPATSGATSLLYTAILAVGYIFFKGMWLYVFAFLVGLLLLIGSVYLYFGIAERLFDRSVAFFSSLLFLLCGPVVFNYLGGMDFALFSFLFLAALYVFCSSLRHRNLILAILLGLLIYTRPEGLILCFLFLALDIFYHSKEVKLRQKLWLIVIPTVAALSLFLLNYKIAGSLATTSLSGRSTFDIYSFLGILTHSFSFVLMSIKGILLGTLPLGGKLGENSYVMEGIFFAPFMFFFFIIGISTNANGKVGRTQIALRIMLGLAVIVAFVTDSLSTFSGINHHRYAAWAYPGIILLAVVGLDRFSHMFGQIGESLKKGFLSLWIIFSVLSLCMFINHFGFAGYRVYFQEIILANWINKNLPAKASIISPNGSLYKYLTNRYLIDAGGTGSKEFVGINKKNIESRILKYLQYSNNLPQYCIMRTGSRETFKELVSQGKLLIITDSYLGNEWCIYKLNLDGIKEGLTPLSPTVIKDINHFTLIDTVDIGYLPSEQTHKYSSWTPTPETQFISQAIRAQINGQQIWDAGRLITGGEAFEIQVTPAQDLLWVARIKSSLPAIFLKVTSFFPYPFKAPYIKMKVLVDNKHVADLEFTTEKPDQWQEISCIIPGKYLTAPKAKISISGRYGSFHHWFYQ